VPLEKIREYKRFALKKIWCSQNRKNRIEKEIQILERLENEFIISYADSFYDGDFYYLITEYCPVNTFYKQLSFQ